MQATGMRTLFASALIAGLLTSPAAPVRAAALPPTRTSYDLRGARVFQNLCVDRQTDDQNGLRVIVRRAGTTPRVLAQTAEGGLSAPAAATSKQTGAALMVEVPGDIPEVTFTGRIVGDAAIFRSHARGAKPFRLPLVHGLRHAPYC